MKSLLDSAVLREAHKRGISLMSVNEPINQDATIYRFKGKNMAFSGMELMACKDQDEIRAMVVRKMDEVAA